MNILVFLPTGKNTVVARKFMAHVIVICVWRGAKAAVRQKRAEQECGLCGPPSPYEPNSITTQ